MCWGKPRESLELARARTTPEQWSQFEREFSVFCDIHGLPDKWAYWPTYDWARWAFWCARPRVEHCINCGLAIDPKCACSRGRAASDAVICAHFERIGLAMMSDEQAQMSVERWETNNGE